MTTPKNHGSSLVDVYQTVISHRGAWYCSAPVTTGLRYFEWLKSIGQDYEEIDVADARHRSAHQVAVVNPNSEHAQEVVARLRAQADVPVIDPTALPPQPGWTQNEWRQFWAEVIRRYVVRLILVDHWQYSNGCAFEYLTAATKGIPIVSESGKAISNQKAQALLGQAIKDISNHGRRTTWLTGILNDLQALRGSS